MRIGRKHIIAGVAPVVIAAAPLSWSWAEPAQPTSTAPVAVTPGGHSDPQTGEAGAPGITTGARGPGGGEAVITAAHR